jgi:hypothetical protein
VSVYAPLVQEAVAGSIDTGRLAEAWQALHPKDVSKARNTESAPGEPNALSAALPTELPTRLAPGGRDSNPRPLAPAHGRKLDGDATKAISPALSAFLGAASRAIQGALRGVLTRLWTEAWVLGNRSALAASAGSTAPDWGTWTPGDWRAAEQIAGPGLRQLLDEAGIRIKSIASSRLEELSAVLEATLRSDEITREPTGPLPPFLSVGDLAERLKTVLDNPANAELVAQAEIARAQATAARQVYAETGRSEVEVSTAEDEKVCPACQAAEELGAHPLGSPPMVPLHPRCRCAELPVLEPA